VDKHAPFIVPTSELMHNISLRTTSHKLHNPCTRQIHGTPSECGTIGRNKVKPHCYKNDQP